MALTFMVYRLLQECSTSGAPGNSDVRVYSEAVVVGATKPFPILRWVTIGLAFAYVGGAVPLVGLFAAVAVWVVVFPHSLGEGGRRDPRASRVVSLVPAALPVGFVGFFALSAAGVPL